MKSMRNQGLVAETQTAEISKETAGTRMGLRLPTLTNYTMVRSAV